MIKHNDIVIVTGVSASGKDFLLSRSLQGIDTVKKKITEVSLGSEIHRLLLENSEDQASRDENYKASPEQVRSIARNVISRACASYGTKIFNTHVAYRQGDLVVLDPLSDLEIRARDYVFIHSEPSEIALRREQDALRMRRSEPPEIIGAHQAIALASVRVLASMIGSRLTTLENTTQNTDHNVSVLKSVIEDRSSLIIDGVA